MNLTKQKQKQMGKLKTFAVIMSGMTAVSTLYHSDYDPMTVTGLIARQSDQIYRLIWINALIHAHIRNNNENQWKHMI